MYVSSGKFCYGQNDLTWCGTGQCSNCSGIFARRMLAGEVLFLARVGDGTDDHRLLGDADRLHKNFERINIKKVLRSAA